MFLTNTAWFGNFRTQCRFENLVNLFIQKSLTWRDLAPLFEDCDLGLRKKIDLWVFFFEPNSNPDWPSIICVYHRWDIVPINAWQDFCWNFGTRVNKTSITQNLINYTDCLLTAWSCFFVLALPCEYHNSDAVHCQGSRNCSEKSARTYQALANLASLIWLKDSNSEFNTRPSSLTW